MYNIKAVMCYTSILLLQWILEYLFDTANRTKSFNGVSGLWYGHYTDRRLN